MEVDSKIDLGDMNLPDDLVACSSKSLNETSTTITSENNKEANQILNGLITTTQTKTTTGVTAATGVTIPQKIAPKPPLSGHKAITVNHKTGKNTSKGLEV
jgi:hypothetical protein